MDGLCRLVRIVRDAVSGFPSLQCLCHKCLERCLPNKDLVVKWDGQQIMIRNPRQSVIGRDIILKGAWEAEVTSFICPGIVAGMTVLDVGADIGYYTLLFAKRVGEHGRVIAFEPISSAREKVEYNVVLNGYSNITVSHFALFSKSGATILEDPFQLSRINPAKSSSGKNDIEIQMVVFDEYASELDIKRIDLVKIDVEGAELDVLVGMRHSLEKYHPALLIEVHPEHIRHFDHTVDDMVGFLETMKYRIQAVDKPSIDFTGGNMTIYCT